MPITIKHIFLFFLFGIACSLIYVSYITYANNHNLMTSCRLTHDNVDEQQAATRDRFYDVFFNSSAAWVCASQKLIQ